jgi:hypothetical protein
MINGTSYNNLLLNARGGNVLIGTDSNLGSNLNVLSTIRVGVSFASQASIIFGDSGTPYWNIGRQGGSGNFSISSYATTAMEIQPTTGNVGIGTTSPYAKLHVNGSIGMSVNSAGYPINAKLVKQSVNTVTFTANVGTIGAWRPGYVSLRVATAQNGLQEYQAAWYFIRVVAYFASSAIIDILDSGGNTGSYTFSYTSTGSGSPQVITFTIADSNASTDTIIADIDFSYTEGIVSLS